jgi:hypothetical protein
MLQGIAAVLSSAVAPLYRDGTLYRAGAPIDDGAGTVTAPEPTEEPIKVQIEACTEAMRSAQGYTDTDVRLIILAPGVDRHTTDDEAEADGVRYALASVATDPANSYWDCRGRRL